MVFGLDFGFDGFDLLIFLCLDGDIFEVMFLGKDIGIKLWFVILVSVDEVFVLIDKLLMCCQEMWQSGN